MTSPTSNLLDRLEEHSEAAHRAAARTAWRSVVLAGLVLGVLMLVGWYRLRELQVLIDERSKTLNVAEAKIREAKTALSTTEQKLVDTRRALEETTKAQAIAETARETARQQAEEYRQVLSEVKKPAALAAADLVSQRKNTAKLLPRVYMQIVDAADSNRAEHITRALQDEKFLVLGTEMVAKGNKPNKTEVRYYKAADEPEARRLLSALRANGEPEARLNYLALETNSKVRPNHFEVWLSAASGTHSGEIDYTTGRRVKCIRTTETTMANLSPNEIEQANQYCASVTRVNHQGERAPSLWTDGAGITFNIGRQVANRDVWCTCVFSR